MTRRHLGWLLGTAAAVVGIAGGSGQARACGGFFCRQTPVDQSGEQIVFALDQNHVTAYIQISYMGNASDFAWVVPVQSKPVISVGSQAVFTGLQQRTRPSFNIEWSFPAGNQCFFGRGVDDAASPPSPTAGKGGVQVLDEKEVGPYQTVTLESKDADELIKWLNDNGYSQPATSMPLIKHYVDEGMLFVALKLKQNASVGEIQPLVLDMDQDPEACVPLILTRVAAVPNMPVLVYVLGQNRAFPRNWFHVEVNLRKLNWMANGSNYGQLVTEAIDEAAGHGFVTEYAGVSSIMKQALYADGRWNTESLRGITDPAALVQALLSMGYPRDQTMQALLRKYIPLPQSLKDKGVGEQQFYNSIGQYKTELAGFKVDIDAFIAELVERVIGPLKTAQAMFDAKPYLTRLYSTVSPDEMNRDPLFLLNPDLPAVSNVHTAKGTATCTSDGVFKNIVLALPDGDKITLDEPWKLYDTAKVWTYAKSEDSARFIELVGPAGKPKRYTRPQAQLADGYLNMETPEAVRARTIAEPQTPSTGGGGGWGCRVAPRRQGGELAGAGLLLMGVTLAVGRGLRGRRRR